MLVNDKQKLIIEEYLSNGFKKQTAYRKYYPNQTKDSSRNECYKFFTNKNVKQYLEDRIELAMSSSSNLNNKLLTQLEYDSFEREIDDKFSYSQKQKAQEMLMKLIKQNRVLDGETNMQAPVIFFSEDLIED